MTVAAGLFASGSAITLWRSPGDPAAWCWLGGSVLFAVNALARLWETRAGATEGPER
jgi:hypothetical protein